MRAKYPLIGLLMVLLVLGLTVACSRARSDAQVASEVQGKINGDTGIQTRQYTVQASNGVVTLSGTVGSDAERAAAANDAASVEGVKTVVNNLQVSAPQTAGMPSQQPAAMAPPPAPAPQASSAPRTSAQKSSGFRPGLRRSTDNDYDRPVASQQKTAPSGSNREYASNAPSDWNTPAVVPSAPPKPVEVTISDGTQLNVRLIDPLDSERNHSGDTFRATLDSPLVGPDNTVVIPAGADVIGRVTSAKSAAHFAGSSELAIELTNINLNGKSYELHTSQYSKQGAGRGKNTAAKVGGGAAAGALIGAVIGGGKGAAIGGAIGAGAGTTTQAATHGQQIKLTSEQLLTFTLQTPITVTPTTTNDRNSRRQRLETP